MMLSPRFFAAFAAAALSLAACVVDSTSGADVDAVEATEAGLAPSLEGKYAFVWQGARKAEVYAELEKKLSGRALEEAKREADEEAADSWIEFGADGVFHSWIGDEEIATARYEIAEKDDSSVVVRVSGNAVRVRFEEDRIVIADPTKGELTFRRVR